MGTAAARRGPPRHLKTCVKTEGHARTQKDTDRRTSHGVARIDEQVQIDTQVTEGGRGVTHRIFWGTEEVGEWQWEP